MRNHTLRASWVATVLAGALTVGSFAAGLPGIAGAHQIGAVARAAHPSRSEPAFVVSATTPAPESAGLEPAAGVAAPAAPRPDEPTGHLVVRVQRDLAVRAEPTAKARVVGTMPSGSKYYDVAVSAWVEEVSADGRWGRVEIPYVWPRRHGWIALRGLARHTTDIEVQVDLSEHRITVSKLGRELFAMPAATGTSVSPTPPGEYFVTDRIPFAGGSLGTFAFGISGIQPNLPPGWTGGNQLAIHGTNAPSSIGRSASAGCLRVSERSLERLKPLLQLGTPVIVVR
ncbi:MAG: L,D-transpeptidase [Actinomycetota bacterium]|nr:L,D-transpeptidase [Actinomycetota bacterium]MDH5224944.1 L,D-transpeptidase [Actinomycetota bacterium]MDH5313010.1 L,D-transpeptidase [Actinomycetota bacterium]